jgi:hypothetical protein
MTLKNIFKLSATTMLLVIIYCTTSSNSTGAAGNTANGCGAVGSCHGIQSNLTTIGLSGIPTAGYTPGQTYTLTLSVSNIYKTAAGFDVNANIGTFVAGAGTTVSGSDITHDQPILMSSNTSTWTFEWIAPTNSTTPLTLTACGNAVNNNGQMSGDSWAKQPFTFASTQVALQPTISAIATTLITSNSAKANAQINANGATTNCTIEYGTTTAYGNTASTIPASVNGSSNTAVAYNFTSLIANTDYHYRFAATNSGGTVYSADATFKTNAPIAIAENEKIKISISPNPSAANVVVKGVVLSNSNFVLYNVFGKKINVLFLNFDTDSNVLFTQQLPKGLYYLQIKNNANYSSTPIYLY